MVKRIDDVPEFEDLPAVVVRFAATIENASTKKLYARMTRVFLEDAKASGKAPMEVTSEDVQDYLDRLLQQKSRHVVGQVRAALHRYLKHRDSL